MSIPHTQGYYTERCKNNLYKRVYAGNGSCPPFYLCPCVMTGGPHTGGDSPANKSRSQLSSNISTASTHDTIESHIATYHSVKWCHEMGGIVPRYHTWTFYFSLFQSWRVKFCHHTCSWEMDSITLWKHMLGVSTWCNKRLRTINCHFVLPNAIEIPHFPLLLFMGSIYQ